MNSEVRIIPQFLPQQCLNFEKRHTTQLMHKNTLFMRNIMLITLISAIIKSNFYKYIS
jgi:hypothetical protein